MTTYEIEVHEFDGAYDPEQAVVFTDGFVYADDTLDTLTIRPWSRKYREGVDNSVYLSIQQGDHCNIILDREVFVEGILKVFPELRRSE